MSARNKGVVLINALLLVAALSAVSVMLLARSHSAVTRQSALQETGQVMAFLDAYEHYVIARLDRDSRASAADHLKEEWATAKAPAEIGGGIVTGRIYDLQGRYNLIWAQPDIRPEGRQELRQLMSDLGLGTQLADAVLVYTGDDPAPLQNYRNHRPPIAPRGGRPALFDDLSQVSGMTAQKFARFAAHFAIYSGEGGANVNTAPEPVLRILTRGLPPSVLTGLLSARNAEPFEDAAALSAFFTSAMSEEALENADLSRFGVTSRWFRAEISAKLGETQLHRSLIIQRSGESGRARVVHRLQGKGA